MPNTYCECLTMFEAVVLQAQTWDILWRKWALIQTKYHWLQAQLVWIIYENYFGWTVRNACKGKGSGDAHYPPFLVFQQTHCRQKVETFFLSPNAACGDRRLRKIVFGEHVLLSWISCSPLVIDSVFHGASWSWAYRPACRVENNPNKLCVDIIWEMQQIHTELALHWRAAGRHPVVGISQEVNWS